ITICEDAWNETGYLSQGKIYSRNPVADLAGRGATLLINISASPFYAGKQDVRYRLLRRHAVRHGIPFVYVNQIGGNDELIFDGGSMVLDGKGRPLLSLPYFREQVKSVNLSGRPLRFSYPDKDESLHDALLLGVSDYMKKTGFKKAVLGLSGGIDSAVTCALAVRAAGRENVLGITLPSPFSSGGSVEDSKKLAKKLGIRLISISIADIFEDYLKTLKPFFAGKNPDVTEENIQARIRGNILMAFSNKFGYLLLSTGNKSELATGYCTLYGDMSGGLAVLSDVPKTMVYRLAEYINRKSKLIPEEIIRKAPSAELRPGQKDQDTLPPYPVLDRILSLYIDEGLSGREITGRGFAPKTVRWVIRTVNRNEYKRRQLPIGLKVTTKAFGMGRRMPIAARYEV
ncbi:MAG TPA: NAD+ synthase, partial [bacterium]|nr:NAD+ synthase [bacterium]